jgi:type 1 fimbriae regulatory protein FimB/type 1 fimbriae regulatory protein FimE
MTLLGGVRDDDTMKKLDKKGKRRGRPSIVLGGVPPRRQTNEASRPREYLTPKEVDRLIDAARKRGRYGSRDATMILVAYRHGLRATEVCSLTWDQIDFAQGLLHTRRLKNGMPSVQPMSGGEMRSLRAIKREDGAGRHVFMTERRAPITRRTFHDIVALAGVAAKFPFSVHPHMLRHATGYKLANDGRDTRALQHYLGHKNIMHTVRYTELSAERFKNFWED